MSKKYKKAFTLTEILIVTSVIVIVAGLVVVAMTKTRAQSRDTKRYADVDTIRMALEYHYYDHGKYPEVTDWTKIEEDADKNGPLFQALSPHFLPQIPRDPRYPEIEGHIKIFSYQYKSVNEGEDYKIHVELEAEEAGFYEVYSSNGEGIIYGVTGG